MHDEALIFPQHLSLASSPELRDIVPVKSVTVDLDTRYINVNVI